MRSGGFKGEADGTTRHYPKQLYNVHPRLTRDKLLKKNRTFLFRVCA